LPSVSYEVLEQDPSVGYIRLNRFSGESSGEIEEAVTSLLGQGVQFLILDLRQNGGGLLDAAVDVSDHFLDRGPVVYQVGTQVRPKSWLEHYRTGNVQHLSARLLLGKGRFRLYMI